MAKYTLVNITNEIDFVGHIWQPDTGLCAGRAHLRIDAVRDILSEARGFDIGSEKFNSAVRRAAKAYLTRTEGDFQEIVDFRIDFGDSSDKQALADGSAFYSEWDQADNEMAFEDANGGDL